MNTVLKTVGTCNMVWGSTPQLPAIFISPVSSKVEHLSCKQETPDRYRAVAPFLLGDVVLMVTHGFCKAELSVQFAPSPSLLNSFIIATLQCNTSPTIKVLWDLIY